MYCSCVYVVWCVCGVWCAMCGVSVCDVCLGMLVCGGGNKKCNCNNAIYCLKRNQILRIQNFDLTCQHTFTELPKTQILSE